jgi:very-short-patch-repair endonuclease
LGSKFDPIYFPKEYNDEQIEIIKKARRNNKVLVQGPPGTGKSHTIANIVCHLLATGKKILITAYTKRALEVLKEKLPDEFQSLVVNLLSGDSSSMQDLQASVNAINEEFSRGNVGEYAKQIEQLSNNLSDVRERIALNTNELIKIKEKSVRNQELNQSYKGTLTAIAEKLEKDTLQFSWYNDDFFDLENHSIENDLKTFIELINYYKKIDVVEFNCWLPNTGNLPTVEDLIHYKSAVELLNRYSLGETIPTIKCNDFVWLNSKLKELDDIYRKVDTSQESYSQNIIASYLKGNSYIWRQKIEMSAKILDRIQEVDFQEWKHNVRISYNANRDIIDLKNDAKALLDYLNQGHLLSGVSFNLKKSFLPKEIKEKLYFIEKIQVNGSPCDTQKELEEVIKDIEIKQDFQELADTWEKDIIPKSSSFDKNIHLETIKVINIIEKSLQLCSEIEKGANIKISPFDTNQLNQLIRATEYNHLQKTIENFRLLVGNAITYLNHTDKHPINNDIINQFQQIDSLSYEQSIKEIQSISNKKTKYLEFKDLEASLKETIPILINDFQEEKLSISQLSEFATAIRFKHAQNEIKKLMDIEYEQSLFNDLKNYEKKEKQLIAKIASILAWKYVIEGLQNNRSLRQYLEAWVQAVKKIGKTGKGKRALKFRKEAQLQMEKCKSSVPCWIMPLYKVAETIQPEQGMYDYVIIDEASQLGPDAIFLLYISKNIIIVGDDKQTSPEYIGVDANTMTPHINRHLKDIPFANYYGTEFSFFDHAKRFCDGITVLREHFRCMPEIIEFCNKHFYARDHIGLYPLKQYSEKRLEPLQSIFCAEGYTEGVGSRIINEPEANRITQKISELVKDGKYKDKTMGVIVLQGNQQGSIIENLLLKAIGESEFHKRKIVCGNSASFQGDERDIIFLSLVTASNHNRAPLTKPEDERRFNVAVSRAKEQIWLFHSVEMDDLSNKDDLRFKLLDHFKNGNTKSLILNKPIERRIGTQPEPFESWFEVDVYNDIVCSGYSVIPQYEVAKGKYRIDLVAIFHDGTKIAIECDGDIWHSAEQYQNDILRQKDLERCGWRFFRVRGYEYYTNRKKALEPLWQMIPKKEQVEEKESSFSKNDNAFDAPEGENSNNNKENIVNSSVNFDGSDESNEVT